MRSQGSRALPLIPPSASVAPAPAGAAREAAEETVAFKGDRRLPTAPVRAPAESAPIKRAPTTAYTSSSFGAHNTGASSARDASSEMDDVKDTSAEEVRRVGGLFSRLSLARRPSAAAAGAPQGKPPTAPTATPREPSTSPEEAEFQAKKQARRSIFGKSAPKPETAKPAPAQPVPEPAAAAKPASRYSIFQRRPSKTPSANDENALPNVTSQKEATPAESAAAPNRRFSLFPGKKTAAAKPEPAARVEEPAPAAARPKSMFSKMLSSKKSTPDRGSSRRAQNDEEEDEDEFAEYDASFLGEDLPGYLPLTELPAKHAPIVVLSVGASNVLAGYAGEEQPRTVVPSIAGAPKIHNVRVTMHPGANAGSSFSSHGGSSRARASLARHNSNAAGASFSSDGGSSDANREEWVYGQVAERSRGVLEIVRLGTARAGPQMLDPLIAHAYGDDLRAAAGRHPVVVAESAGTTREMRDRLLHVVFNVLKAPYATVYNASLGALAAEGRTTGLLLDVGETSSRAIPFYDGDMLGDAVRTTPAAGRALNHRMRLLLQQTGTNFQTSAEMELVREIKEQHAYVSLDPASDERLAQEHSVKLDAVVQLPDGNAFVISHERFRCAEALFDPSKDDTLAYVKASSLQDLVLKSIMSCDAEIRRELVSNIVVVGQTAKLPNFQRRLVAELKKLLPQHLADRLVVKVQSHHAGWRAAADASLKPETQALLITREQYNTYRENIVRLRCPAEVIEA